jgi:fructose-1,6-bisphosphatase/inositol monophosphatase family enzyme
MSRGKADVWLSGAGMPWDYAPVRVIAEEAGAVFMTSDGTGRIDAGHCVVCSHPLRKAVCGILDMPL